MKKLNILLLSAIALGLTVISCSKDNSAASAIVGNWKFDTDTVTQGGQTDTVKPYNKTECAPNVNYLNIKTGGALTEGYMGALTSGGDPCTVTEFPGTWTLNDKILHVAEDGYTADYTVISVTSTLLTVKWFPTAGDTSYYHIYTLKK